MNVAENAGQMVILSNIAKAKSAYVPVVQSGDATVSTYHQESGATVAFNYRSALQAKLND